MQAIDKKNHRKMCDQLKDEDIQILELDFGNYPDKLRRQYLNMYE